MIDSDITAAPRSRQTALITGASAGIGYELAKIFAADRYDLVLVARREGRLTLLKGELEEQYGISARILAKDLTEPTAAEEIFEELSGDGGAQIDVLVNNAGIGRYGDFKDSDATKDLDMIQLNVTSLVHLTRLFLPGMVERGHGKVMNVASTAAFQPGPLMAVYYATKSFVVSFSNAIHTELAGTGVTVTAFCPGPTRTEFHGQAGTQGVRLFESMMMDADKAARVGYEGMRKRKMVVIPGAMNNVMMFVSTRLLPRSFVPRLVRFMQGHMKESPEKKTES
jgi:short-subunit dehydrogenase